MRLPLSYPSGSRLDTPLSEIGSEGLSKFGPARFLMNVRMRDGKWETRPGTQQWVQHSARRTSDFQNYATFKGKSAYATSSSKVQLADNLGLYVYRFRGQSPIIITAWRLADDYKAFEVALYRGRHVISTTIDAAVFEDDVVAFRHLSFAQVGQKVYMAGPFLRGVYRVSIRSSDAIAMGYLKPQDRSQNKILETDEPSSYLSECPSMRFILPVNNSWVGVHHDIPFRLIRSNYGDGDSIPGLNYQDIHEGGEITGIGEYDGSFFSFKRDRIIEHRASTVATPYSTAGREIFVPSNDGCVSHHSITKTPYGLVFLGGEGLYLLGKDRNVVKLSAGYDAFWTGTRTAQYGGRNPVELRRDGIENAHGVFSKEDNMVLIQVPGDCTDEFSNNITSTSLYKCRETPHVGLCYTFSEGPVGGLHFDTGRVLYGLHSDVDVMGRTTVYAGGPYGEIYRLGGCGVDYMNVGTVNSGNSSLVDFASRYATVVSCVDILIKEVMGDRFKLDSLHFDAEALANGWTQLTGTILSDIFAMACFHSDNRKYDLTSFSLKATNTGVGYGRDESGNIRSSGNFTAVSVPYQGLAKRLDKTTLSVNAEGAQFARYAVSTHSSAGYNMNARIYFTGRLLALWAEAELTSEQV